MKTGIGYNLRALKVTKPEIYNKYKLLFCFFNEDETVYQNELSHLSPKVANKFFEEMHPEIIALSEGKITFDECMEITKKKGLRITETKN